MSICVIYERINSEINVSTKCEMMRNNFLNLHAYMAINIVNFGAQHIFQYGIFSVQEHIAGRFVIFWKYDICTKKSPFRLVPMQFRT